MKQQHCASRLSPSRLCRLLIAAFTIKLLVLGAMLCEPLLPPQMARWWGADQGLQAAVAGSAHAADGSGAAPQPAAVGVDLPDVGMSQPLPAGGGVGGAPRSPASAALEEEEGSGLPRITASGTAQEAEAPQNGDLNRELLLRKQEDLARKEQQLQALEKEISAKLEEMQSLEGRLRVMMKDADETQDAKFRHLVDVLSNMKAKQAAAVLETLDRRIAVRVLAGMRGRQAGEILSFVQPERAALLTEDLARMQLPLE